MMVMGLAGFSVVNSALEGYSDMVTKSTLPG